MFFERSINGDYIVIDRNTCFIQQIAKNLKHSTMIIKHKVIIDHATLKLCFRFISINNRCIKVEIRSGIISKFIIDNPEGIRSLDIFWIDFVIFLERFICFQIFSEFIMSKTRKLENWFISWAFCEDFIRDDSSSLVIFIREE